MEKQFVIPKFPTSASIILLLIAAGEIIGYGIVQNVPLLWFMLTVALFYLAYSSLIRKDNLPLIFAVLFFTAYDSLFFNLNTNNFPIAFLFVVIFAVNSVIMWFLLHYATHLKREYHIAYTVIAGFLIAQIITLFASMWRENWPFQLEIAAYIPTVFSYTFWRFACLSADSVLGWKQFVRMAVLVIILTIVLILGTPNNQV